MTEAEAELARLQDGLSRLVTALRTDGNRFLSRGPMFVLTGKWLLECADLIEATIRKASRAEEEEEPEDFTSATPDEP